MPFELQIASEGFTEHGCYNCFCKLTFCPGFLRRHRSFSLSLLDLIKELRSGMRFIFETYATKVLKNCTFSASKKNFVGHITQRSRLLLTKGQYRRSCEAELQCYTERNTFIEIRVSLLNSLYQIVLSFRL